MLEKCQKRGRDIKKPYNSKYNIRYFIYLKEKKN